MERETGFEPATSTLARLHSTTELLPLNESRQILAYAQGRVNQTEHTKRAHTSRPGGVGERSGGYAAERGHARRDVARVWKHAAVSALAQFSGAQTQRRIPGQD